MNFKMVSEKKLLRTQRKIQFLKVLKGLKPQALGLVLSKLNEDAVNLLSETVFNILYTNLSLNKRRKKRLRKQLCNFEKNLRYISDLEHSWQSRQKKICQSGGKDINT